MKKYISRKPFIFSLHFTPVAPFFIVASLREVFLKVSS